MANGETNTQADAQVETQVKKDFENGWHFSLNHMIGGLSSGAAMIGLDIKNELKAIALKVEARFKK